MILGVPASQAACKVEDPVFASYYRINDQEGNFNDYGRIHWDADSTPSCAQKATWALTAKVKSTVDYIPPAGAQREYQDWLRGAHIALIFAAAQRLGANGYGTKELDTQLKRAADDYQFNLERNADGTIACNNIDGTNSCIDDYAVAASGYAWIAAYKYRRNQSDPAVATFQTKARQQIDNFFQNVCRIPSGNPTVLCKDYNLQPPTDNDQTLSFNHGQQMPPYGFGLMTSIASAVLGLGASGDTYSFTAAQKSVARALMREMQQHVDTAPAPDVFDSTCVTVKHGTDGSYTLDSSVPKYCGGLGTDPYQPQMYALNEFYTKKIGNLPVAPYMSTNFYSGHFNTSSTGMSFFSFSRRETYGEHGYDWWPYPGPEWMPFDKDNPIGFLEQVSSTGLAQGWTCDWDAPSKSIVIDIYAGTTKVTSGTVPVRADSFSESAIRTECRGGDYHRFWIQLPTWTKGQAITAYGLDYTWFGNLKLYCLTGDCTW